MGDIQPEGEHMRIPTILIIGLVLLFGGLALAQSTTTATATPTVVTVFNPTTTVTTVEVADTDYCHSLDALEEKARSCRAQGQSYYWITSTSDGERCKTIACVDPAVCPTVDQLEQKIEYCLEKEKVSYTKYQDEKGCTQIKCVAPTASRLVDQPTYNQSENTTCKKIVNEKGCVEIYCNDGYRFNSCDDAKICTVQNLACKSYTDADGCYVTSCSNGETKRSCPDKQEVKCEVEKLDDGCYIKTCSDGTRSTSCSAQTNVCRSVVDNDGCTVTKCENGKSSRECPVADVAKEVKCEVFERSDGHRIKECDNGFRVDYTQLKEYCAKTGVNYEDSAAAAAIKCVYGDNGEYTARVTDDGTRTECVINFEAQTEYCTDGTVAKETKQLPEAASDVAAGGNGNSNSANTAAPSPNASPIAGLMRFFASIFGGN